MSFGASIIFCMVPSPSHATAKGDGLGIAPSSSLSFAREAGRFGDRRKSKRSGEKRIGKRVAKKRKGRRGKVARTAYSRGCTSVCSRFGARTRCDGSTRSRKYPIHRGIDIAVSGGTPILAVANGIVIGSRRGSSIGGIALVLKHPPKATGMKSPVFSIYKHLRTRSHLPKGTRVRKGQTVASSGKTGTVGGYYGSRGFPHLHFEISVGRGGGWRRGKRINPKSFLSSTGSRTVWPLSCR